jgi:hypothetical protein
MGVWRDNSVDQWSLHLKLQSGESGGPENDIRDHLPSDLADLAAGSGITHTVAEALKEAQDHIDAAIAAFPDRNRIRKALSQAAHLVEKAKGDLDREVLDRIGHRLERKLREIDAALFETHANVVRAAFKGPCYPGSQVTLDVHVDMHDLADFAIAPRLPDGIQAVEAMREPGHVQYDISIPASAAHTSNYPDAFDPIGGNGEATIRIAGRIDGRTAVLDLDPEEPLKIRPLQSLGLDPEIVLVKAHDRRSGIRIQAIGAQPVEWEAPEGWKVRKDGAEWIVDPPERAAAGVSRLIPIVDGRPASQVQSIAYPHIRPASYVAPAELKVLSLDVAIPASARIGYVGGGSDNVGIHMRRLGLDVTDLGEAELKASSLSEFTTIVVGIFAFGLRRDLQAATGRLHRFVEDGGHLVTLYHRPTDGWDPDHTPPRRLAIGSPSLRWRVTDPFAPVTVLKPDSPLLSLPNRIEDADWQGWDKERGLYFASDYDPVYEELLALNDPGENPLKGSLISASIGRGRHTHVALVLHHQLDKLVPGSFRLLANLVQPA